MRILWALALTVCVAMLVYTYYLNDIFNCTLLAFVIGFASSRLEK